MNEAKMTPAGRERMLNTLARLKQRVDAAIDLVGQDALPVFDAGVGLSVELAGHDFALGEFLITDRSWHLMNRN